MSFRRKNFKGRKSKGNFSHGGSHAQAFYGSKSPGKHWDQYHSSRGGIRF
nr:MAG: hypothetical protein [Microviridae sp.]